MEINYDKLVKDYNDSLFTKLRNFAMEEDFLELWVPDEDNTRSLYGIVEAAFHGKVTDDVQVRLSPNIHQDLDYPKLTETVKQFAEVSKVEDGQDVVLTFKIKKAEQLDTGAFQLKAKALIKKTYRDNIEADGANERRKPFDLALANSPSSNEKVDPAFKSNIEEASKNITNEGELKATDSTLQVTIEQDGVRLSATLNSKGIIQDAKHSGASGLNQVLADRLCELMKKRSIQECGEHASIRLMNDLYDERVGSPVRGILTPKNADPCFKFPLELSQSLYASYLKETATQKPRNFWVDKVSKEWLLMDEAAKKAKIQSAMESKIQDWGLQSAQLEVVSIQNDVRVTLSCASMQSEVSNHLIQLERELHSKVEPQLEVQLEGRADRNRRVIRNPPPGQMTADQARN